MTQRLLMLLLLAGWVGITETLAQTPSESKSAGNAQPRATRPPPLPSRTPVDYFRELLGMNSAEREEALSSRSQQARSFLTEKLKEFEVLPKDAREIRLQTLQLRWLLLPLMKLAPGQRASRLESIPESDRRLVEERLAQWDQLPADVQRGVLENESFLRFFICSQTNLAQPELVPQNSLQPHRDQLAQQKARWEALPENERQRILAEFERLLALNSKEKDQILNRMSGHERQRMSVALRNFERLPQPQRDSCLRGFRKFSELPPEERQQFLENVERWQSMTPKDRQLWRDLVARLQPRPPLPPGARPSPPPPPGAATRRAMQSSSAVATN